MIISLPFATFTKPPPSPSRTGSPTGCCTVGRGSINLTVVFFLFITPSRLISVFLLQELKSVYVAKSNQTLCVEMGSLEEKETVLISSFRLIPTCPTFSISPLSIISNF